METVVVRYGEIGSKSPQVRGQILNVLRQRIQDRLEYGENDFESVSRISGRLIVETSEPREAAKAVSDIPGVASCSPAYEVEPKLEQIKAQAEKLEIGETFGVETNRAGDHHDFTSHEVNRQVGADLEQVKDVRVDLDHPDTWVRIDVRTDTAFVYTEILDGPDGFPVGSQGKLVSLVSGGIDSPVASYRMMTRGIDILPVYFYNKPVAAEDHVLRFKSVLNRLEKFHPSKEWDYYIVDMEEVNKELMKIDSGRMILHRIIMFKVAERIAEKEGLNGMVTGESLGQKSSQTPINLERTSKAVDKPVHRPLLTEPKTEITEKARQIGTMQDSNIKSACSSLAPENPATELKESQLDELEQKIDVLGLVEKAVRNMDKKRL